MSEKCVHAFISLRLDYCNRLFTGVSKSAVRPPLLIHNAAARVITRTKKSSAHYSSSQITTMAARNSQNQLQNMLANLEINKCLSENTYQIS